MGLTITRGLLHHHSHSATRLRHIRHQQSRNVRWARTARRERKPGITMVHVSRQVCGQVNPQSCGVQAVAAAIAGGARRAELPGDDERTQCTRHSKPRGQTGARARADNGHSVRMQSSEHQVAVTNSLKNTRHEAPGGCGERSLGAVEKRRELDLARYDGHLNMTFHV